MVAPAPDSDVTQSLRVLLQPYLTLLRLNNKWDFFAPEIGEGSLFRYVIEDKDGQRHTFSPADELSWFHPKYFWVRFWQYAIMDEPDLFADAAAERFCKEQAALHPTAVTLIELREKLFTQADLLSGRNRTDARFYTVKTTKHVQCQG